MAELSANFVWVVLAGLLCFPVFVACSPDAQRKLGIWLISKADASDKAREHFLKRREELREQLGTK